MTVGVPLPKGKVFDCTSLVLLDNGTELPSQRTALSNWNDGSLKWVLLDFQASVDPGEKLCPWLGVRGEPAPDRDDNGIEIEEIEDTIIIDTGCIRCIVDKNTFSPFVGVMGRHGDNILTPGTSVVLLTDERDKDYVPHIDTIAIERSGPLRATLKLEGTFQENGQKLLSFAARMHFYFGKSRVRIDFSLLNSRAARHEGGLWDLGDPGSVLFRKLVCSLRLAETFSPEILLRAETGSQWQRFDGHKVSLYQDSSGGENWHSTNHVNREADIPLRFRGYRIYRDGTVFSRGLRASPVVHVGTDDHGVSATIRKFWQNFPKALSVDKNRIDLALFPDQCADLHELQGGERKTHTFLLEFGSTPDALVYIDQPLRCTIHRQWYAESGTVPYLSRCGTTEDQPYDELLEQAVKGENSFYVKREKIDEYGWRNFGEVYADHEAVGHEGDMPLVSHYNNQYDQVFGFFREYIASGNDAWFDLMNDLASHVADIDIYHTVDDRNEYNNGLHWHTNHYLDAATCTHRSFSKSHLTEFDARFYGGGPGMEHCYATGFMYHYFLTGEELSREALLTLADWICSSTSDPTTILAWIYRVKALLPQWKQALTGQKVRADRFPLTRGSGNPLSVLIDAYMLSSDRKYLKQAETVVKGCIHPFDDIESRDLLDAEVSWSYTVCLQAIGKYLDLKISLDELDYLYSYAQASLLHYAKWMLEHEYPYLEKSEILEFPNETWPAQDLRKSCVFYFAAKHSVGELREQFFEKANYFHHYVINKLNEFETRSLARPIALLMQNRWMHAYFSEHLAETAPLVSGKFDFTRKSEFWTKSSIVKKISSTFVYALKNTSIAKERYWLRCRKNEHI